MLLETSRLRLRRFGPADAPALAAYRSDSSVARYQSWAAPVSADAAAALVRQFAARSPDLPGWFQYAVEVKADGGLAGDVGVNLHENLRQADLGFTLAVAYQGQGYATEAVRAVLADLFGRRGLHRASAECDARNHRSARLLERLGFAREGLRPQYTWLKGEWTDDLLFGLLADNFKPDIRTVVVLPTTGLNELLGSCDARDNRFVEQLSKRLFNWASILEPGSREQALKTASMPFVYPHLALMPDAHQGKGATVGSVIPTTGAIMPAAVGVDIGCGMNALRTQFTKDDLRRRDGSLATLREAIENVIPLSAGVYNTAVYDERTEQRIAELETVKGADQAAAVAGNWPAARHPGLGESLHRGQLR